MDVWMYGSWLEVVMREGNGLANQKHSNQCQFSETASQCHVESGCSCILRSSRDTAVETVLSKVPHSPF